jgi:hypothetical protein
METQQKEQELTLEIALQNINNILEADFLKLSKKEHFILQNSFELIKSKLEEKKIIN